MRWAEVRDQLRELVEADGRSARAIAEEIGVAPGTLRNILNETVGEPYGRTRELIDEWVDARTAEIASNLIGKTSNLINGSEQEQEVLEYVLEHFETMATFMTAKTQNLKPADRRLVMYALVSALKQFAIENGKPLPPGIFDLEKRLMLGES